MLIIISVSITAIGLYLGLMIISSRFLTLRDKNKFNLLKKKYSTLVFESMRSDESRESLFDLISKKPKDVSIVKEVCKDLLKEVEGETKNSVIEILEHPLIRSHYLKYLNSFNKKRKVKALLYFKSIKVIPDTEINTIKELLDHRLHYLAHAGALAILASSKKHLHESTLIHMSMRSEDCKYTFVELLWEYWDNEFVFKDEKFSCFQILLGSENISLDMKALLVRIISSFNEDEFSIYFHDVLKFLNELELSERQYSFHAALITALAKFDYKEAEGDIIKAASVDSEEVKIAAVRALFKFRTEKSIEELVHMYKTSEEYLKKEISFAFEYDEKLKNQIITSEVSLNKIKKKN